MSDPLFATEGQNLHPCPMCDGGTHTTRGGRRVRCPWCGGRARVSLERRRALVRQQQTMQRREAKRGPT